MSLNGRYLIILLLWNVSMFFGRSETSMLNSKYCLKLANKIWRHLEETYLDTLCRNCENQSNLLINVPSRSQSEDFCFRKRPPLFYYRLIRRHVEMFNECNLENNNPVITWKVIVCAFQWIRWKIVLMWQ